MTTPGRTAGGRTGLLRLGLTDLAAGERALRALGLWDDAPVPGGEDLLAALAATADPDLAVTALERLAETHAGPALLDALRTSAGLRERLLAVLATSTALGDALVAAPEDWRLLLDDDLVLSRPSPLGLSARLLRAVGADLPGPDGIARGARSGPEAVAALRTEHRRCLLELVARDLTGGLALEDVAGELADLAAAVLTAGLAVARAGLPDDLPECRLAVVAMGKTGGRELNYVSDVDVVLVAEGDARAATSLASGMVRVCGEVAWPVDTALRPEGKDGPLVRTVASHEAYYRRWARTWEFQALLKARPVAGDLDLGREWATAVAPLVWSAAERPDFVADVQAMRQRVESTLKADQAERELKLGPGGLRDVEFAVQLLQLVHGRADESVRSGTTLRALEQLAAGGYVGREDARHLAEAYRWLRTVEHRLQLHRLRRTHLLPPQDDEAALRRLARTCGYRPSPGSDVLAAFLRDRYGYLHEVRRLHEKLFYRPLLSAVARLPADQARLEPRLTPEAAAARLRALGFAEPTVALRHLEALTEGVSRRAAIQQTLLPVMLSAFADAADPDAGLLAFRQVSEALGSTPWFLRLLRDEGEAAERLARLLASSRFVSDLLVRAPDAVRLLGAGDELQPRSREALTRAFVAAVRRRDDWEQAVAAARGLRRQELLRVACADLLGLVTPDAVGRALSDVAAATVAAALATAVRKVEAERRRPLPVRLAVVAMGRLGGGESGYGSDADVLFVHEAMGGPEAEASAAAFDVANEVRRLLALPAPDPPLVVDADLRPEGKQGPLSRSRASYAAYYDRWSHVWEAQALLRAAPLAGDEDLAADFLRDVAAVRYPEGGLDEAALREVRRIKARVEAERVPRGVDRRLAPKLGPGGIADVEWTVQLLQLQHAHEVEGLRTPSTLPALDAARDAGLLDPDDADVLRAAWCLATRVRDVAVLTRGKPVQQVPPSGRELARLARALGYPAGEHGQLLEDYLRATRRARAVVDRVFYGAPA